MTNDKIEIKNNERQKAVDALLMACVERKRFDQAENVLNLHPSIKTIDFLVTKGFENRWCDNAIKLIEKGLTSKETLNSLIKFCIEKGWVADFESLAKLRGMPPTKNEIDAIIKTCIQQGYTASADYAFELRGTPPSTSEIDSIVKACIKNKAITDTRKAASRGASKKTIELLADAWVRICIEEGRTLDIQKAAKMRNKPLAIAEIKELTESIKARR